MAECGSFSLGACSGFSFTWGSSADVAEAHTNPCALAVSTIVWAQSGEDEQRLLRCLGGLAHSGYPVAVADRGTNRRFTDALRALPGITVTIPSDEGLVAQIKASFSLAADFATQYFLYVEPDKEEFFVSRLSNFVARAIEGDDARLVLASRSSASFRTFPPMQQYTEGVFNHLCSNVLGVTGDYTYGPFLMHRTLLPHIAGLNPKLGWGWRPSTFAAARRHGVRIVHAEDDHPCPADQRREDARDRLHRIRQLAENIAGLLD